MPQITLKDFPKDKIFVQLKTDVLRNIIATASQNLKLNNFFELANWINFRAFRLRLSYKINGGDISRWLAGKCFDKRTNKYYLKFIPLWVILELIKVANINDEVLQRSILAYRAGGSGNIISNPKLPIKITPELVSTILHLMGDGYAGDWTPAYSQKNSKTREIFIQKIKNCFGSFKESHYGTKEVRFPKAVTDILIFYFNIKSFMSKDARIPTLLFNLPKKYKLACLTAFIIDEGAIRDIVQLFSANRKLLCDIKRLAESCGYICNPIKYNKVANEFVFGISNKSAKQLLCDVTNLEKNYPLCGLSHKHSKLKLIVEILNNPNSKKHGLTRSKILKVLSKHPKRTIDIANEIRCWHGVTAMHLRTLHKQGAVERVSLVKGFAWKLKNG
jgi:hypothetical protein